MKNKKLIYVLIPVVAIVWGLIIYKVLFYVKTDPDLFSDIEQVPVTTKHIELADTFSLINDYPDPFLETRYRTATSENTSGINKGKLSKTRTDHNWPEISLGGIVVNKNNSKQNICISINRKNLLLTVGEEKEEVRLVKIYKDSVLLEFCGEEKFIRK